MASIESPIPYESHAPDEGAAEKSDYTEAFEQLYTLINGTVYTLEQAGIQPNTITEELRRIPFGRFNESHLMTSFTNDEGYRSGVISFVASEGDHDSFIVRRRLQDEYWRSSKRQYTDAHIATKLHANWPQLIIDNDMATELIRDDEDLDISDIAELVGRALRPHAPHRSTDTTYTYRHYEVDGTRDEVGEYSLTLTIMKDDEGHQVVEVLMTTPSDIDDSMIVPITCRLIYDELGDMSSITTEYPDTDSDFDRATYSYKKKISERVADPTEWIATIGNHLTAMVREKQSPLGN
ncbi:MAG: hypothetical protein ABIP74_01970 [Candidatus Saccharimonas sp.]